MKCQTYPLTISCSISPSFNSTSNVSCKKDIFLQKMGKLSPLYYNMYIYLLKKRYQGEI